jgi:hypothetical protein
MGLTVKKYRDTNRSPYMCSAAKISTPLAALFSRPRGARVFTAPQSKTAALHQRQLRGNGAPESSSTVGPRRSKLPAENPSLERNPGLKHTRMDSTSIKFNLKMELKLKKKINVIRKYCSLNFRSIQWNHLQVIRIS